jgi:hypothetical protein
LSPRPKEREASFEPHGTETFDQTGTKLTLEHVVVTGVAWGREDVWLDPEGTLAAVITRNSELRHFEAARVGLEALLPVLAKKSAEDEIAWLAQAAKGAERPAGGLVALAGGTLIDGSGRPPVRDAVVVVQGDRIVAAGPRAKVNVPPGATAIDLAGKWIVPGLWDMHAHVDQVEQGASYLAEGVTVVRDMGNELDFGTALRDALDAGACRRRGKGLR